MNTDNNHKPHDRTPEDAGGDKAESPEVAETPTEQRPPHSVARGLLRLLALLLLMLLIGGIAAGGWFGWQWWQQERALQAEGMQQQAARMAELEARLDRISEVYVSRNDFESLHDNLAEEQRELRRQMEAAASEMQALREAARGGRRDLALGEIEYLLRTAADALYLANDIDTAIYALQAADDRTRQLGEPRLNPVRERIADHLQALNAVRMPDVQGMAMKLGSMMRQVSGLPLRQAQHARAASEAEESVTADANWWQRIRDGFGRMFNKLVVVQRAEPPPALLSPEEHFFLYRNVELQFSAARAALLAGDAASYRQSLEIAREWLNHYFDRREPAVQNMLADINGLLDVSLQPALPDINPALERFRALNRGARTE